MNQAALEDPVNTHRDVQALMPWWVNGSLEGSEFSKVADHLTTCAACAREAASLKQMQAAIQSDKDDAAATRGLDRMKLRVEQARIRTTRWRRAWQAWQSHPGWLRHALAMQLVLIASLLVFMKLPASNKVNEPSYRTLSAPAPPSEPHAYITVIFGDDVPQHTLRAMLTDIQAKVVDGPTPEGAYVLALAPKLRVAALAKLRSQPAQAVVFAEPSDMPTLHEAVPR